MNEIAKKQIKPGIYKNISFDEYLSWDCFHKSMVASTLRSTAHLAHYIENDKKKSKAMGFGSLVDCIILEPDEFQKKFSQIPETYINSKKQEAAWTMQSKTCRKYIDDLVNSGKIPYSKEDQERAKAIRDNINSHRTASEWMQGEKQVSIVWEDSETGILCKGRLDVLGSDIIADLKITHNASEREFKRTINNFLYHVQAAMYLDGLAALNGGDYLRWGFVVGEDLPPHCTATYELGPDSILTGKNLFRKAIRKYKDFLEMGPVGYSLFAEEINIPNYALILEEDK